MCTIFVYLLTASSHVMGFPGDSEVKASASNVGDPGSILGLGRCPGEGNGKPLQYSCLENPMDGEAWWATMHGVAESQTRLSNFIFSHVTVTYIYFHIQTGRSELCEYILYSFIEMTYECA